MPLVTGDFADYLAHAARGDLRPELIEIADGWSVCLVLASAGYPTASHSGDAITGLGAADGARVYHAGTRRRPDGTFETSGGRVLAVVATGATRDAAREAAYRAAAPVQFDGRQMRGDIAKLHFE